MDSESARMSSAAEARYRIDYPNSKPRVVKVVALDAASEHVVKRVAERQWQRAPTSPVRGECHQHAYARLPTRYPRAP
jgi:hypothetical protein